MTKASDIRGRRKKKHESATQWTSWLCPRGWRSINWPGTKRAQLWGKTCLKIEKNENFQTEKLYFRTFLPQSWIYMSKKHLKEWICNPTHSPFKPNSLWLITPWSVTPSGSEKKVHSVPTFYNYMFFRNKHPKVNCRTQIFDIMSLKQQSFFTNDVFCGRNVLRLILARLVTPSGSEKKVHSVPAFYNYMFFRNKHPKVNCRTQIFDIMSLKQQSFFTNEVFCGRYGSRLILTRWVSK